jgi:hypothetical protein
MGADNAAVEIAPFVQKCNGYNLGQQFMWEDGQDALWRVAGAVTRMRAIPIFEHVKTSRGIAVCMVAGALFTVAIIAPRAAVGRIRNCEHASLLPKDSERLALVAGRVLPAHQELMLAERCRWSYSAFAWVTTARVTAENGVAQWWMASCSRDARNWTCEPGVFHQEIEKSVDVEGVSRQVKIRFDAETNLETAEILASKALQIYVKTTATLPYCSGVQGQESRWRVLRDSHPLPTPGEDVHISVSREKDGIWVWFGDFVRPGDVQIGIDFPASNSDQSTPCWSARES